MESCKGCRYENSMARNILFGFCTNCKRAYVRNDDREMFSDQYILDEKHDSCYDCKYFEQCYLTEKRMKKYPNGACQLRDIFRMKDERDHFYDKNIG